MSRLVVAGLSFLLLAVALVPAQAGITPSAQLTGPPTAGVSAPFLPEAAVASFVEGRTPTAVTATCTADCGADPDVSCSGSSCTAVDRNCAIGERGYVSCTSETWCPTPCPVCNDGETRWIDTGGCCKSFLAQRDYQRCIGGQWVHQYYGCYVVPQCPWI